ncbi:hypothetical protein BH10BAC2_BH10BAC2_02290 [soil metagenome]
MAISYSKYAVSMANFVDKTELENEDFIKMNCDDQNYASFILCDGAGGVGVFSKEWAQHLANETLQMPDEFEKNSNEWFFKTSRSFHDTIILKKDLSDLMLSKKVYRDGSYSTFCACWLDLKGNKLFYSAIGDTYLFIFQNEGGNYKIKEVASVIDQQEFDENPKLLNWNIELKLNLPFKSFDLKEEFVFLMVSDSLAKWIILNLFLIDPIALPEIGFNQDYINSLSQEKYMVRKELINMGGGKKSFKELLLFLKEISSDKTKFKTSMEELYGNSEIEIDDYSLIYIEGNVS